MNQILLTMLFDEETPNSLISDHVGPATLKFGISGIDEEGNLVNIPREFHITRAYILDNDLHIYYGETIYYHEDRKIVIPGREISRFISGSMNRL